MVWITLLRVRLVLFGTMLSLSLAENPICSEQMNEGSGDETILLYFYDKNDDICRPFYYKGLEGNENRFESDKECMETCSPRSDELYPTAEEVCKLQVNHGSCFAMLLKYYYDQTEGNCRLFHYGGCQGNGNRFDTREECQRTCMARSGRLLEAVPNPDEATTSAGVIVGVLGVVVFVGAVTMAILLVLKQRKEKAKRKGRKQEQIPAMEMN